MGSPLNEDMVTKYLKAIARSELLQAAFAYTVVLCVAFPDVVFGGRTLLTSPYMASVMPQGPYEYPERPLQERFDGFPRYDPASSAWITEPNAVLTHNLCASGQLPLWNPYVGAGQPLAGDLFSGVFNPLKFFLYIWPDPVAWDIFYLLQLLIAGVFACAYMRKIRVSRLGSFGAGLGFMLNGYFISFMNMPHVSVEILLPALLFSCEKVLRGERKTGMILGILTVALAMVGGNPEATFFALALMTIYYFWRCLSPFEGETRSRCRLLEVRDFGFMVGPGMMLFGFVILPFLELVLLGAHAHGTHVGVEIEYSPITSITFLIPEFFGRQGIFWLRHIKMWAPAMGVVPLMVAVAAIPGTRDKRKFYYFFGVYLILYLLKAHSSPVINWIGYLPILNQCFINKYGFPLAAFGVVVCAGLAIENVQSGGRISRAATVATALGFLLLVISYLCYFGLMEETRFLNMVVSDMTRKEALAYMAVMSTPYVALAVVVAMVALVIRSGIVGRPLGAAFLVLLLFLEPKYYLVNLKNPVRYDPFTKAPYITLLQRELETVRFVGLELMLPPAYSGAFGLCDIRNFNAVSVRRNIDILNRYFSPLTPRVNAMLADPGKKADLLDLCNIKYVITPKYLVNSSRFLVYDRETKIYVNPDYLPRTFVINNAVRVSSSHEALEMLGSNEIDVRRTVILENAGPEHHTETAFNGGTAGEASIEEYRANSVRIHARATSEGYLVLLDTYYPGWKATVDGVSVEIMPAYYLFRAIRLPAGDHEAIFKYTPGSYKIGLAVSLAGLLAAVWVIWKIL